MKLLTTVLTVIAFGTLVLQAATASAGGKGSHNGNYAAQKQGPKIAHRTSLKKTVDTAKETSSGVQPLGKRSPRLRANSAQLDKQNVSIDKGMQEAGEKAEIAMRSSPTLRDAKKSPNFEVMNRRVNEDEKKEAKADDDLKNVRMH